MSWYQQHSIVIRVGDLVVRLDHVVSLQVMGNSVVINLSTGKEVGIPTETKEDAQDLLQKIYNSMATKEG